MKTINDYAELVKEKHALNKTIAPVETDLTDASREYHIGEQFIINGGLFKAKTEIAQHDALVLNTNYEPADNLTEQIKNAGGGTGTDPRLDVFENNIAPVETDETDASQPYQVGEQLILDNILYDVIAPISEHDVITTTGSGANIEPADPISSEIQTLTNKLNGEVETRAKLSAHNLFNLDLAQIKAINTSGTWNDNVYTFYGVSFTVNDNTVTFSGTAEEALSIRLCSTYTFKENSILSGCPSISGVRLDADDYIDTGNGVSIPNNTTVSQIRIRISRGTVIGTPVTAYPMIRLASDPSSEPTPYAMTNRELTENLSGKGLMQKNELVVSIAKDNTKTVETLLNGLFELIKAVQNNLGDNQFMQIKSFYFHGMPLVPLNPSPFTKVRKTSGFNQVRAVGTFTSGSNVLVYDATCKSTGSTGRVATIGNSYSSSDITATAETVDGYNIVYEIYDIV